MKYNLITGDTQVNTQHITRGRDDVLVIPHQFRFCLSLPPPHVLSYLDHKSPRPWGLQFSKHFQTYDASYLYSYLQFTKLDEKLEKDFGEIK